MIPGGLGSELATTFLVGFGEVGLEGCHCLGGFVLITPFFACGLEHFGGFNGKEGLVDGSFVGDGVIVGGGKLLGGLDSLEKCFQRFIRIPFFGKAVTVGLEVIGGNRTVCGK